MANTWFAVYLCNIWRKKLLTVLYLIPCALIYIKNEQLWGYGSYTSLQDIEPFWLPSLWPSSPFDSLSLLPLWPIHQVYYYYCIRIGEAYQIFYVSVAGKSMAQKNVWRHTKWADVLQAIQNTMLNFPRHYAQRHARLVATTTTTNYKLLVSSMTMLKKISASPPLVHLYPAIYSQHCHWVYGGAIKSQCQTTWMMM